MTEQTPDPTGVEQTTVTSVPLPGDPAPADTTSSAPAPVDPAPVAPSPATDAPAPAPATPDASSSTPAAPPASSSTSSAPKVGDLCTFTTEDEGGFTTLNTCVVFEVFTEPGEDGKDRQLARVGILPDERIVAADRLETRS